MYRRRGMPPIVTVTKVAVDPRYVKVNTPEGEMLLVGPAVMVVGGGKVAVGVSMIRVASLAPPGVGTIVNVVVVNPA